MAGLFPTTNALSLFAAQPSLGQLLSAQQPHQWLYVVRRFQGLMNNLAPTPAQIEDGATKQAGVRACLNRHYWGTASETANSMLIGSWGKQTRVRPSRDVDILFLLPPGIYHQYQTRTGNRQSQLLQEVKSVLSATYPQTAMRGDGQVVVIPFNTTPVEVAPGFRCTDGSIIVCDTNNGGRYITSTAEAEARDLQAADIAFNGNARALARIMKRWQREKNVSLKSFQIERLAIEFLRGWAYSNNGLLWHDWMVRDVLGYLVTRAGTNLIMPGTGEVIPLGHDWQGRAETAYGHAVRACIHEQGNYDYLAGDAWQEIFGTAIPRQAA
jgi:hypothetical protein